METIVKLWFITHQQQQRYFISGNEAKLVKIELAFMQHFAVVSVFARSAERFTFLIPGEVNPSS